MEAVILSAAKNPRISPFVSGPSFNQEGTKS